MNRIYYSLQLTITALQNVIELIWKEIVCLLLTLLIIHYRVLKMSCYLCKLILELVYLVYVPTCMYGVSSVMRGVMFHMAYDYSPLVMSWGGCVVVEECRTTAMPCSDVWQDRFVYGKQIFTRHYMYPHACVLCIT